MAFGTGSRLMIDFAWVLGVICTVVSFMMMFFVVWFRRYVANDNNRQNTIKNKWENALLWTITSNDTPSNVEDLLKTFVEDNENDEKLNTKYLTDTSISKKETPHFLYSWNYLQESLRGDAANRLNVFGQKLALEDKANNLLKSPLIKNRILAINTLGNLKAHNSYKRVLTFAKKNDPIVSVWAFRAMFRIKPEKTRDEYLKMIVEREDWSPAYIAKILNNQGGDKISEKLVELTEKHYDKNLNETQMARLVSYLKFAHVRDYSQTIEKILDESEQIEVLIACMRLLKTDESLPKVRKFLKHERWELRMFAVMTLGRFGHNEDINVLIYMLEDLNWWVRYYAARSILSMPLLTKNNVRKLSQSLPNEFQKDILKQVLAEDSFQCFNRSSTILSN